MNPTAGPDDDRPLPRPTRRTVLAGGLLGVGGAVLSAVPAGATPTPPSGRVISWGSNVFGALGRLGTGPLLPGVVLGLSNITAVAAGGQNSYAIGAEGITAVAGAYFTCYALRADGRVLAWGSNLGGELGRTTPDSSQRPLPVPAVTAIRAIAAGERHALALT